MSASTTQHGNMIRLYEEVLPVAWTRCNAEFIYFYCNLKFKKNRVFKCFVVKKLLRHKKYQQAVIPPMFINLYDMEGNIWVQCQNWYDKGQSYQPAEYKEEKKFTRFGELTTKN